MQAFQPSQASLRVFPSITGTLAVTQTIAGELGLPFGVTRSFLVDSNGDYIIDSAGDQLTTKEITREA